ncbi:LAME_0H00914g1_1 [Lachancea meyersii CBS 8951]|uniref:LAME_0H00914g1_1 n=1 Tax=Lachancea meyersii CBS 8951 TaxID=1266667 RepID=A0A1G4KDJ1_9SACH|nr:LAME_0H00914g1_1 [Lachancea meyersii CBS 8951]
MARRTPQVYKLLEYVTIGLVLIAAVELFKYSTRVNYEWFHCTPVMESLSEGSSAYKIFAVGGPSCDKRGEFKSIMKKITYDYEPNDQAVSFCIKENESVAAIHYPIDTPKGSPGYVAYAAYTSEAHLIDEMCADATIMHF